MGQEPDVSIARGEFCTFGVKVVNAGKQAGDFHAMSQYAYDARGAEYSTDLSATYSSNRGNSVTSDQLNPGASLEATLVFDVPRGTVLTHLILHESYFSPGVKVALG